MFRLEPNIAENACSLDGTPIETPKASRSKKRCFDLSKTSLDVSKQMVLLKTSDGLEWSSLHAAIVEKRPVEREHSGARCLWINMALEPAACAFAIDGRKEHHELSIGTISFLAPRVPIKTRLEAQTRSFDLSIGTELLDEVAGELFDWPPGTEVVSAFGIDSPSMASLMRAVMCGLHEPAHHSMLRSEYLVRALVSEILAKHAISRRTPLVADMASCLGRHQLQRVMDYIDENISCDLSLNALAAVAGLSRTVFIQRFKRSVQQTPHRYILSTRVRRGREMLANSDMPITHVAAACGFADHAHFTSVFKKMLGITPSVYRQSSQ